MFLTTTTAAYAGYKARPWPIRPRDSYPATLTSEGVTIAVEPLFTNELAAKVFDKNDIVTRGIMPLAVVIFNDNDFAVVVDGDSIELVQGEDHFRSLPVEEVVHRLFQKRSSNIFIPRVPRVGADKDNQDALEDFSFKALRDKRVMEHDKGGGFLYLRIAGVNNVADYLSKARVYIPEVYRQDTGSRMIYFEIDLKPAVEAAPVK
jgi:hypothetical protein